MPTAPKPSRTEPRVVAVYRSLDGSPSRLIAHWGCSDSWLTEHPDWASSIDSPGVLDRIQPHGYLAVQAYPEGTVAEITVVVTGHGYDDPICSHTWTVTGIGPAVHTWDAARLAGVSESTIRSYYARGQMPPDDYPPDEGWRRWRRFGGPAWRESTIHAWLAQRPGQGARTDLDDDR